MNIKLLNWIYATPRNPLWAGGESTKDQLRGRQEISTTVREAIAKLPKSEQHVLIRRYFDGATFTTIAEERGKSTAAIQYLHRHSLRTLKKLLAGFVRERYGIELKQRNCCLCKSSRREEIDSLILAKKPEQPYRVLFAKLKSDYGIRVSSYQTLVGHIKYHD